jgi:UDP-glucose 4-epimerase
MRILITGGAGFIGSHLCDAFLLKGYKVSILDNLSTGSETNIIHLKGRIIYNKGDIKDKRLVEKLVKNSDMVIHMAAAVGVSTILRNPIESISTNFYGSEIVLNAALKFDKRLLIASTSEIYGKNPKQPLSEIDDRVIGTPQKLRWTYSDAKALEEATAYYLYVTNNLRVSTIRFFNTVGPRQTGKYGMVIPNFISAAMRNEPIEIFGSGLQTRVFCHVWDAVQAVLNVLDNDVTIGEVLNVGGIEEISILQLAQRIINQLNSESIVKFIPYSDAYSTGFEDMERRVPDISKIKNLLGWEPKLNLETIIRDISKT